MIIAMRLVGSEGFYAEDVILHLEYLATTKRVSCVLSST